VIDAATGMITDANRAAELAYRYPRDELLSLKIFDLRVDQTSSVREQMHVANNEGILFETVHRRKDGSTFPVEVSSRGDETVQDRRLFSIIRDISERKRFEAERAELLAATQRALALRDDFLVISSHELRTPVTHVSLQLQQLLRLIERGAPLGSVSVVADAALREANRLTDLIAALLDAQVAKRQIALEPVEIDLAELVREIAERLRLRAEQVGSEIVLDLPAIRGHWDRMRIDQVVSNLLSNALKYGGARPVRVLARRAERSVCLEIRDQGIGVPSEDQQRIFDKFERAVPQHYGGLGLGLYIARQAVEAHGGSIEVESSPGLGSTFRVILPLQN
jgi:PAS domain S-box-containing protein